MAFHGSGLELPYQGGVRALGSRYHQQSRRILVESVHDTRTRHCCKVRVVVQKRIENRAIGISRRRMYNDTGSFVDHNDFGVLENYVQGDILCSCRGLQTRAEVTAHQFPTDEAVAGPPDLPVNAQLTALDPILDAIARVIRQQGRHRLIEAHTCKGFGYVALNMCHSRRRHGNALAVLDILI
jgi:hypothetical protein